MFCYPTDCSVLGKTPQGLPPNSVPGSTNFQQLIFPLGIQTQSGFLLHFSSVTVDTPHFMTAYGLSGWISSFFIPGCKSNTPQSVQQILENGGILHCPCSQFSASSLQRPCSQFSSAAAQKRTVSSATTSSAKQTRVDVMTAPSDRSTRTRRLARC